MSFVRANRTAPDVGATVEPETVIGWIDYPHSEGASTNSVCATVGGIIIEREPVGRGYENGRAVCLIAGESGQTPIDWFSRLFDEQ